MSRRAPWTAVLLVIAVSCSRQGLLDEPHDGGTFDTGAGGSATAGAGGGGAGGGPGSALEACGNGAIDPAYLEECDDGNTVPGDGCDAVCRTECLPTCGSCSPAGRCLPASVVGDGVAASDEQCDDGNAVDGDGCTQGQLDIGWQCPIAGRRCIPSCGDGMIKRPETCDDLNTTDGDGCSSYCLVEPEGAHCGDGVLQGAEACDEPPGDPAGYGACTAACRYTRSCGDGVLDPEEECDFGVQKNFGGYGEKGGCTPACKRTHYCGDGFRDRGEQCDLGDGNSPYINGLPCTSDCKMLLP